MEEQMNRGAHMQQVEEGRYAESLKICIYSKEGEETR